MSFGLVPGRRGIGAYGRVNDMPGASGPTTQLLLERLNAVLKEHRPLEGADNDVDRVAIRHYDHGDNMVMLDIRGIEPREALLAGAEHGLFRHQDGVVERFYFEHSGYREAHGIDLEVRALTGWARGSLNV